MTRLIAYLLLALFLPAAAQAACYAEYKAKKDNPLRLHYGIMQLGSGECPGANRARRQVAQRLSGAGWTLLAVTSLSDTPPSDQQRANAGEFYLRY